MLPLERVAAYHVSSRSILFAWSSRKAGGWSTASSPLISFFLLSALKESYCIHELEPGYEKMGVNTRHV